MNGSILWKIIVTVLIGIWAVANLLPLQDTPFPQYLAAQADTELEEFNSIMAQAEADVQAGAAPTLFVALKNRVIEDRIDFSRFFGAIDLSDIKNLDKRNEILLNEMLRRSQGKVRLGLDLRGGVAFTFTVNEADLDDNQFRRTEQLEKAKSILADRVDGLGVAEPVIRLKGDNAIEIQMPGISTRDNPNAVAAISAPALLEFSTVHRTADPRTTPTPPLGYSVKIEEREDPRTGEIQQIPQYVKNLPDMTGDIIENAYAAPNEFGGYRILLSFTSEGENQFAAVTRQIAEENERTNTIGQLAILLDGKLYSAPTVRQEIRGGAEISGRFTQREAIELANVLNNPLEVGLELAEMYEIGPSLAAGARDASLYAGLVGGLLVFLFMVAYYKVAGLLAMITVALNVLLVFGTLSNFGATLTLPGVAALVLTIGMAVDANILIFERIREELKLGKSLHTAVVSGFDKAFSTIVDANVTTLITAMILFWLGTGPVKGFGVTLAIGILATMFCSLIVSRWLVELLVNTGIIKKMLTWQLFKDSQFEFLNHARRAFAGSWALVLIGVIATFFHWHNIFGIDFVGGDEITLNFSERIPTQDIEAVANLPVSTLETLASALPAGDAPLAESFQRVLADGSFGEANPLYQSMIGQDKDVLAIQTENGKGLALFHALSQQHPQAGLELVGETRVGATVGDEVTSSALKSIALALLAILLYVALRFEIGYGLGAVTATIHDILMTVGLFVALGEFFGIGSGQFTAPMIAAILMTVGYSINDTIVVFDRIREELDLNPGVNLRKIIHLSINRVLNRTILTSVTTLLATLALYGLGAGVVVDFALVFILGILTGTFSSIFIASPVFFWYHKGDRKRVEEGHILPTYDWTSAPEKPPTSA